MFLMLFINKRWEYRSSIVQPPLLSVLTGKKEDIYDEAKKTKHKSKLNNVISNL